jgi:hypothetical protein
MGMSPAQQVSRDLREARNKAKITSLYDDVQELRAMADELGRSGSGNHQVLKRVATRKLRAAHAELLALAREMYITLPTT